MRLRILALLRDNELCVCQVMATLGSSASTISEHLTLLRRCGWVQERKDARRVYYRLSEKPESLALLKVLLDRLKNLPEVQDDARNRADVAQVDVRTLCATVTHKASGV